MTRIYCDGGAFPNPGKKIVSVIFPEGNKEIVKETGYGTNSEAEYEAFLLALKMAKEWGLKSFTLCSDSMLVLNQLAGNWKIKQEKFLHYKKEFDKLKEEFEKIDFEWVRSEENLAHQNIETLYPNRVKVFSFKKKIR